MEPNNSRPILSRPGPLVLTTLGMTWQLLGLSKIEKKNKGKLLLLVRWCPKEHWIQPASYIELSIAPVLVIVRRRTTTARYLVASWTQCNCSTCWAVSLLSQPLSPFGSPATEDHLSLMEVSPRYEILENHMNIGGMHRSVISNPVDSRLRDAYNLLIWKACGQIRGTHR